MTGFNSSPVCPACGARFNTPAISGGYVRCPECDSPMFQYRFEGDDDLTPGEFMHLLHPRANNAIGDCRHWFPGGGIIASGKAAAFVVKLWPTLAQVFGKEAADA